MNVPRPALPPTALMPSLLWTLERYYRAINTGVFTEKDKLELLYGIIVELMPAGSPHEECVSLLSEFFRDRLGGEYRYREEKSIALPDTSSVPEPDFVVVAKQSYGQQPPQPVDIYFVAEVANTSLARDRTVKVQLYAQAELAEYWIINLVDRQIEVHLNPNAAQLRYGSVTTYAEADTFSSPFAGEVVVSELLPAAPPPPPVESAEEE